MAHKLKYLFDASLVHELASDLVRVHPAFDASGFVASGLYGLDRPELTARARPRGYPQAWRYKASTTAALQNAIQMPR